MRYLVDGHNLIPQVSGLALDMPDDEEQLINRLQEFCRVGRHQVEVYFDGTPPEYAGRRKFGVVTAVFVRKGLSADEAIRRRLGQLGKQAKQWTLVSSDQVVLAAGGEKQASLLRSEEFARKMEQGSGQVEQAEKPDAEQLSAEEVDDWLSLFRFRKPH